jgi:hypothetical protein
MSVARIMADMADSDALVRWETAALRESPQRRPTPPSPAFAPRKIAGNWMTLREAQDATAIPIETLRKWARREHIPSRVVETEFGTRRIVDMDAVTARARDLGREIPAAHVADEATDETPPPQPPVAAPPAGSAPAPQQQPVPDEATTADPGTMIVPIAAWDRVLMQLGNLHKAGQELAEARERAARAETEAVFLRERLAELRAQMEPPSPPTPSVPRDRGRWGTLVRARRGKKY